MKGVGEDRGWRCHGRGAGMSECRRRGLCSPVREGRFLLFSPLDRATASGGVMESFWVPDVVPLSVVGGIAVRRGWSDVVSRIAGDCDGVGGVGPCC